MTCTNPKISIIMAVYNAAPTLEKCLLSVREQTYPHTELIVIDGGSTDGSVDMLRGAEDILDYWVSEPDGGIYHAWNKGLRRVTGDWVHFMGADDYFPSPDTLAQAAQGLRDCPPEIRIVYGTDILVTAAGEPMETRGEPWERIRRRFRVESCLPHSAAFHHMGLFTERGGFDESFRIAGDYELLLRELKTGKALFLSGIPVKAVTCGGVSMNWDASLRSLKEHARARRKNGISPYNPAWAVLVLKAMAKNLAQRSAGNARTRTLVDLYRRLTGRLPIWTKM